jgi:hypothetical protein
MKTLIIILLTLTACIVDMAKELYSIPTQIRNCKDFDNE